MNKSNTGVSPGNSENFYSEKSAGWTTTHYNYSINNSTIYLVLLLTLKVMISFTLLGIKQRIATVTITSHNIPLAPF